MQPPHQRRDVRAQIQFLEVPDPRPRSATDKLLDRPDLIAELRHMVGESVAYLEPWNVTESESRLARRLGLPLNGTAHKLWPLGFKSSGRRIMRSAGVPVAFGVEDVRSLNDIVAAVEDVRRRRPGATGIVVKTDNSGAGDGNRILEFSDLLPRFRCALSLSRGSPGTARISRGAGRSKYWRGDNPGPRGVRLPLPSSAVTR